MCVNFYVIANVGGGAAAAQWGGAAAGGSGGAAGGGEWKKSTEAEVVAAAPPDPKELQPAWAWEAEEMEKAGGGGLMTYDEYRLMKHKQKQR